MKSMILIVDISKEMGASLERVLRYRGFESLAVQDGMEALALMNIRKPELIMMELSIGGIEGIALLQAIRKDATFADVPVIIYTEEFADEARRAALASGAQEFIVKGTIGWESLVERIRSLYPVKSKSLL
jgi:DNA-binding response OmpR family regulator